MKAYCCNCKKEINGKEVKGDIIYSHRPDLYDLDFIQCPICRNYTGKYNGEYPTIPTVYIRQCRYKAHRALDKIWKDRKKRARYYAYMSEHFKKDFHWGMIRSDSEADKALNETMRFLEVKNEL